MMEKPSHIEQTTIEPGQQNDPAIRQRQQVAVSRLSELALHLTNRLEVMAETVALIVQAVEAEFVNILELMIPEDILLLRAGVGWTEGLVGEFTIPIETNYAIKQNVWGQKPLFLNAPYKELPQWTVILDDHNIKHSLRVVIQGRDRPFGLLEVHSTQPYHFNELDANFLKAMANVLAIVLEREYLEAIIGQRNRELLAFQSAGAVITSGLDLDEVLTTVAKGIANLLKSPGCAISAWNQVDDTLQLLVDYGPDNWSDKESSGSLTNLAEYPLTKQVLLERTSYQVIINQPDIHPTEFAYMKNAQIETLLMLPMVFQDRVVGLIEVMDDWAQRIFTPQEVALGQLLANQAASAIENARLYTETEQRLAEQTALRKAATAISSTLDLETVLNHIAEQVAQVVDTTSVYICDYDPHSHHITVIAEYISPQANEYEQVSDLGTIYDLSNKNLRDYQDFIETGQPFQYHIDDPFIGEMTKEHLQNYGAQAELGIPLIIGDRIIGLVDIWESRWKRTFTPNEINLCQGIAQQAAVAIENARLYIKTQRQATELSTLLEATTAVSSTLDLERILQVIAEQMTKSITVVGCTISRWDHDLNAVVTWIKWGHPETEALDQPGTAYLLADYPMTRLTLETRQPVIVRVDDPQANPAEVALMRELNIGSLLCLPLVAGQEVIGIVELDDEVIRDFTPEEVSLCQALTDQAAIAIENAQLYEQVQQHAAKLEQRVAERTVELQNTNQTLERHLEELAALNRISQTVASTLDFEQMLQLVTQEMVELFKADTSGVALLNPERTELTVVAEYTVLSRTESAVGLVFPLKDNPYSGEVIEMGKPVMLSSKQINPVFVDVSDILTGRQVQCIMILPLMSRGQVIGTIGVDTTQSGREFTPADLVLAETVAGKIAAAIDNARLFKEEYRQRQIAKSLQEIGAVLNSSLDQDTVLGKILEQMERVIEFDGAGILLKEGDMLELVADTAPQTTFVGFRIPLNSDDPAVRVFNAQQPLIIDDVHADPGWEIWEGGAYIHSWMGVPLIAKDEPIGVLTADSFGVGAYSQSARAILEIFAHHAALAVQNAQLYEAAQQEIIERKKTEEALAEARDQALAASHLKSELLAKVSHELRTPLNAVLGFTELLQREMYGPISTKQNEALNEIMEATGYLTNLVNELLDQATLDAGKLKLTSTSFAPIDLVSLVQMQMMPLAQAKNLHLTVDIATDLPDFIIGDAVRLRQILTNLVSNAIKFTKTGSVQIQVYPSNPHHWVMQVMDTGPGIPEEAQSHIFEPFGQVDGSLTRQHSGTGLGLSIVRQLVTLMGGQIDLKSKLGQGSIFIIRLPLEPVQDKEIDRNYIA